MTKEEKELFIEMKTLLQENKKDIDNLKKQLEESKKIVDEKINEKNAPIYFEQDILRAVQHSMNDAIKSALTSYGNPLSKLVERVIKNYEKEIESAFNSIVDKEFSTDHFKLEIEKEFMSKLSRSLLAGMGSNIDSVIHKLKQDSVFRSKLTLLVDSLVEEYNKK